MFSEALNQRSVAQTCTPNSRRRKIDEDARPQPRSSTLIPGRRSRAAVSHSVNQSALAPPLALAMTHSGWYWEERGNRSETRRLSAVIRLLLREREQDISWKDAAMMRVPRIHIQHAADNRRSGVAHRPAIGFHVIHSREFPCGVVFPQDLAVTSRIGAEAAVHRSGKRGSRDQRDGRCLRRFTGILTGAARAGNTPYQAAGAEFHGVHAATRARVRRGKIRVCRIDIHTVCGGSPKNTAAGAAVCNAPLPDDLSAAVRIKTENHTGFVPDNDQLAAAANIDQKRRTGKVKVRRVFIRTCGCFTIGKAAASIPDVILAHLVGPTDLSRIQVESNE